MPNESAAAPPSRRSVRPPIVLRLPRRLVYSVVMVALVYAIAEGALRVRRALIDGRRAARPYSFASVTRDGVPLDDEGGAIPFASDPHLVYRPRGPQALGPVTLASDGFRGPERALAKPAGTRRVVVLGGSAAFGMHASGDERVFTALLEARLDAAARAVGGRVEVLNRAVIGYDSTQELVLLATELVDLAPDVVVLFDGWNDFYGSGLAAADADAFVHPKFVKDDRRRGRAAAQPFLEWLRGFELVRAIDDGIARQAAKAGSAGPLGDFHDRSALAVPRYARNVRAMVRIARAYGAATLVAPQPELFSRGETPPEEQEMRRKREKDGYSPWSRLA